VVDRPLPFCEFLGALEGPRDGEELNVDGGVGRVVVEGVSKFLEGCGLFKSKTAGSMASSEEYWEPGSAMVPTFSADPGPAGSARFGDLPLAGEGGGEPNNDPSSSPAGSESTPSICMH
jgi:hypothetical protein